MEAIRTRAEQEACRRLAVKRVGEGWSPSDTAAFLGVHVETVRKRVGSTRPVGMTGWSARRTPVASHS